MKKVISIVLIMMLSLTLFACGSKIETAIADADAFIAEGDASSELYCFETDYDTETKTYIIAMAVDVPTIIQTHAPKSVGNETLEMAFTAYIGALYDNETETIATILAEAKNGVSQYFEGLDVVIETYYMDTAGEFHQYK